MHTPTHLLIGAAAFGRPGSSARNWAAIAGALMPDLPMFVMFGWARFGAGLSDRDIWPAPAGLYWQEPWQTLVNAGHSIPLLVAILLVGRLMKTDWVEVYALSGLLHVAFDLPVHREDAHAHFWPFSDWKFVSPVSYWDRSHSGGIMGAIEIMIVVACMVVLWRRFESWRVRVALGLAFASLFAAPLYFSILHH